MGGLGLELGLAKARDSIRRRDGWSVPAGEGTSFRSTPRGPTCVRCRVLPLREHNIVLRDDLTLFGHPHQRLILVPPNRLSSLVPNGVALALLLISRLAACEDSGDTLGTNEKHECEMDVEGQCPRECRVVRGNAVDFDAECVDGSSKRPIGCVSWPVQTSGAVSCYRNLSSGEVVMTSDYFGEELSNGWVVCPSRQRSEVSRFVVCE